MTDGQSNARARGAKLPPFRVIEIIVIMLKVIPPHDELRPQSRRRASGRQIDGQTSDMPRRGRRRRRGGGGDGDGGSG